MIDGPYLSTRQALLLAAAAVASFHVAYLWEPAGGLIVVYLACMFGLAWLRTPRVAFYSGMAVGLAVASVQLHFFYGIFEPGAVGLWMIFGLWQGLFLVLGRIAVGRWPRYGALWLPVIWMGLEVFRSEIYYLRFSWLVPGFALSHPFWVRLAVAGVYGFSFLVLLVPALIFVLRGRARWLPVLGIGVLVVAALLIRRSAEAGGCYVVGIQLEGPAEPVVIDALDRAAGDHPEADLFVLSEYTFNGAIPDAVLAWCKRHGKHLVAGGKDFLPEGGRRRRFHNTAFVVSPEGEVVFRQAKSVPIQFFSDGLPAPSQEVWESPWGRLGFAICYDLSYARVTDRLVGDGAEALVVPTMDVAEWGAQEHKLHAKIAPVRAREYGIPIFRVASSGASQLVDPDGRVIASAPFPGQGEQLAGLLPLGHTGSLPPDRYAAPAAVLAVLALIACLGICRLREATDLAAIRKARSDRIHAVPR